MGDKVYEEVWVEKEPKYKAQPSIPNFASLDAEEDPFAHLIKQYTSSSTKKNALEKKQLAEKKIEEIRMSREVNTELNNSKTDSKPNLISIGDGGASWLRKSFKRAKELSTETGRPLQDIIAERWGSLQNFKNLLEQAEKKEDEFFSQRNTNDNYKSVKNFQRNRKPWQRNFNSNVKNEHNTPHPDDYEINNNVSNSNKANDIKFDDKLNLYDHMHEKLNLPNVRIGLLDLNKIGAEYMRYYIKCEMGSKLSIDEEAQRNWFNLLKMAQDKYLSQPYDKNEKVNRSHGNGGKVNSNFKHNRNSNSNPQQQQQFAKSFNTPQWGSKAGKRGNDKKSKGRMGRDTDDFSLEYDGDSHFDIQTGEFVLESKRVKQEIDLNVKKQRDAIILNYNKAVSAIENCYLCFDSPHMIKHTLINVKTKSYLAIPGVQSLVPFECFIAPVNHITSLHDLDDETWEEIKEYMVGLKEMFERRGQDLVFLYGCFDLKKFYHTKITCIPISKQKSPQVPMYFKNAIIEAEYEWSDNRKLIDMGVHLNPARVIPKALPYFAFQTTRNSDQIQQQQPSTGAKSSPSLAITGYAHIIENKSEFPSYFGKEVLAGILNVAEDHNVWRKPRHLNFEEISKANLEFTRAWKGGT